jgi:hypothetical protein
MDAHEPGHPDVSSAVLTGDTRVRDVRSSEVKSADEWIARRMDRDNREREECLDELMNAIARGDLVVEP